MNYMILITYLMASFILLCYSKSYIKNEKFSFKLNFSKSDTLYIIFNIMWILLFSYAAFTNKIDSFTYFKYNVLVVFLISIGIMDYRTYTIPMLLLYWLFGIRVFTLIFEIILYKGLVIEILQLYGFGFLFTLIVSFIVYFVSKKGIGEGDIILISIIGLYTGLANVMVIYLLSSIIVLFIALVLVVFKKKSTKDIFPMVPALAIATIINTLITYLL